VNETAFAGAEEAGLVDGLRSAGDALLSLVAVLGGRVVGHAMFQQDVNARISGPPITIRDSAFRTVWPAGWNTRFCRMRSWPWSLPRALWMVLKDRLCTLRRSVSESYRPRR